MAGNCLALTNPWSYSSRHNAFYLLFTYKINNIFPAQVQC